MNNKQEDEIFCPECGKPIKKNAVICPYCGIQVKELKTTTFNTPVKSKAVAVVLAIFFIILMVEMRLNFGFIQ